MEKTRKEIIKRHNRAMLNELKEFDLYQTLSKKITSIKPTVLRTNLTIFKCTEKEQVKEILENIKPVTKKYQDKLSNLNIHRPYKITLDNSYNGTSKGDIKFVSEYGEIWITFPAKIISIYTGDGRRGITESEYVHFLGRSKNELRHKSIPRKEFFGITRGKIKEWYDGNQTLLSESRIDEIIEFLKGGKPWEK
ncbi:MAG: hypothetical protein ACLFT4_05515 [Bacteroidales bacterium]